RPRPRLTLFPYTTLFRSLANRQVDRNRASLRVGYADALGGGAGGVDHPVPDGDDVPARLRDRDENRRRHPAMPRALPAQQGLVRSEEHTSELQSRENLVC